MKCRDCCLEIEVGFQVLQNNAGEWKSVECSEASCFVGARCISCAVSAQALRNRAVGKKRVKSKPGRGRGKRWK